MATKKKKPAAKTKKKVKKSPVSNTYGARGAKPLDKKKASPAIKIIAAVIVAAFGLSVLVMALPSSNWEGALNAPTGTKMDEQEKMFSDNERMYKSMSEVDPKNTEAWKNLGNTYYDWAMYYGSQKRIPEATQKLALAVTAYQKTLELEPDDLDVRTDMGTALFYLGDTTSAISELEGVVRVIPTHTNALFNLGVFYSETNTSQAIRYFEDYLKVDPDGRNAEAAKGEITKLKGIAPK